MSTWQAYITGQGSYSDGELDNKVWTDYFHVLPRYLASHTLAGPYISKPGPSYAQLTSNLQYRWVK